MTDLISLSCPSCGASLQVSKDMTRAKCPYCGHENIIRVAGEKLLELHSQCPICHRNDRTKKVSAMMSSASANRAYFAIPPKPDRPGASPISQPPRAPVQDFIKSNNNLRIVFIVLWIFAFFSFLSAISNVRNNSGGFFFVIVFGLAGFFVFRKYKSEANRSTQTVDNFQMRVKEYEMQLKNHNEAITHQQAQENEVYGKWISNWEAAVEKWKKLYYCERDDCVFIPGSETTAALKDIEKFCYSKSL